MGGVRIGRTIDGRYVPIEHPDAAFLAYTQHDDVPADVLEQLGQKQAAKPADKQAAKPADKSRGRGRAKRQETVEQIVAAGVDPDDAVAAVERDDTDAKD